MKPLTINLCGYDKHAVAGGPLVWLMRFPAALRDHGIGVRIQLLSWEDPEHGVVLQSLRGQGFDVTSHRFSDTCSNIRHLMQEVSGSPPDIFVPNLVTPAFFAGKWLRSLGIPTIGVLHSDDTFYRAIQDEFVIGQPEYAVSAVVCVSEELLRQVVSKQPANTTPVRIPYGVPIPERRASRVPGKLRIGFVGRLAEEQKRISEVARSLCRVTRELAGVEATIYGDGPDQHNVERILAAESNSIRVKLAGPIPPEQIQNRLVEECDTIVLLSDYEGLPISLLEAMACGVVPVCLNIRSGIPELIQHGVTGLIVCDRQASFTDAIRQLRDDPELWDRMSISARERVRTENSLDVTAVQWIELFRKLHQPVSGCRTITLPRRFALPPINSVLASHDPRSSRPALALRLYRNGRKFAGRVRRRLMGRLSA